MLQAIEDYYWIMAARGRMIRIDEGRTGLCTFFVLHSDWQAKLFHARPMWTTPTDYPTGTLIYIDQLMAKQFDRDLLRCLEVAITDHFPQAERAVWYRPGTNSDRCYRYNRRLPHGTHVV